MRFDFLGRLMLLRLRRRVSARWAGESNRLPLQTWPLKLVDVRLLAYGQGWRRVAVCAVTMTNTIIHP